jgi:hypothetical protein
VGIHGIRSLKTVTYSFVLYVTVFETLCMTESQLSEDALNLLAAHAHRRIEQLQRQIAEHDKAEKERLIVALARLSIENERLEAEQLEREREHLEANLHVEEQKWVSSFTIHNNE